MSHENATQMSVGQTGTKFLVVVCLMALGFAAAGCIVAGNAIQKANKAEEELALLRANVAGVHDVADAIQQELREEKMARKHLEASEKRSKEAEALLSEVRTELDRCGELIKRLTDRKGKCDSYLAAARDARDRQDMTADVLYASALRYAEEKMPILLEYVAWKKEGIHQMLSPETTGNGLNGLPVAKKEIIHQMKSLESAREHLSLLKLFCDSALEDASLQDLRRVNELRQSLAETDNRIQEMEKGIEKEQQAEMNKEKDSLSTADRKKLDKLAADYDDGSVLPKLDEERVKLLTAIQQWRACCINPEDELQLPELVELPDEVLKKWLDNFTARLGTSSIPWEQRAEELAAAESVLEYAATKKENEDIKASIDKLNACEKEEMSKHWSSLADKTTEDDTIDVLLSQVDALNAAIIREAHRRLLGRAYDGRILRCAAELDTIKDKVTEQEMRAAFISGVTTQCWQLKLEIQLAQEKYQFTDAFREQLNSVECLFDLAKKLVPNQMSATAEDSALMSEPAGITQPVPTDVMCEVCRNRREEVADIGIEAFMTFVDKAIQYCRNGETRKKLEDLKKEVDERRLENTLPDINLELAS